MIHELDDYEKLKVFRPILGDYILDEKNLPVMHKITEDMIDFTKAVPLNIKNLSARYDNSDKIVLPFNHDKDILKYWNDPMKYIPVLQTTLAVGTPDYSVASFMNPNELNHNVYKNRWLGCLWQEYGVMAIPTIQWSKSDTYDICFGGIEKGGIVIVSTIGCAGQLDVFCDGFHEMQKRLEPSLIIVFGDMLPGMYGRFINYQYQEAFNSNHQAYKQLSMFDSSIIFEKREDYEYGKQRCI